MQQNIMLVAGMISNQSAFTPLAILLCSFLIGIWQRVWSCSWL